MNERKNGRPNERNNGRTNERTKPVNLVRWSIAKRSIWSATVATVFVA